MKKILFLITLLAATPAFACDTLLAKYNQSKTVDFCLYITDATTGAVKVENAVHASGDTYLMKDEGAEANTTNAFTDEGSCYSIVLTATEMSAARVTLNIEDQGTKAWADKCVVIETYGNASAEHAFDLDAATQSVTIGANGITDTSYSLPQFTAESGTTLTLAASAVAVDDQFNTGFAIVAYDNSTKGVKARSCIIDSTNTGETIVTAEDISGLIVGAGGSADYYSIQSDGGCLLQKTGTELSACPTGTANPVSQLEYLFMWARNKIETTSSSTILRKDDGSTALCTHTISDNGTTFTRAEGS